MATDQWAEQLLEEATKMWRVPGIVFVDGGRGRVPRVAGTGIEVFEVIQEYLGMGRSWERLTVGFDWLRPEQLRAALAYYEAFPDEVNARIEREWEVARRLGAPTDP